MSITVMNGFVEWLRSHYYLDKEESLSSEQKEILELFLEYQKWQTLKQRLKD